VWDESNAAPATQVMGFRAANVPVQNSYGKRKKRSHGLWPKYLVIDNFFANSTRSREKRLIWSDEYDVGAIARFQQLSCPSSATALC
jgi:hypothetical protein